MASDPATLLQTKPSRFADIRGGGTEGLRLNSTTAALPLEENLAKLALLKGDDTPVPVNVRPGQLPGVDDAAPLSQCHRMLDESMEMASRGEDPELVCDDGFYGLGEA